METKKRAQALLDHAASLPKKEEEEEEEEKTSSWARSTSTMAASSFWCAHRQLRQRHVQGWFSFLALCSLWLQTGPDARHHDRYDQEDTYAPRIW